MSKQYEKACDRCNTKIKMSDELGKWRAFNISDNSVHECKNTIITKSNGNGNDLSLELVLKKLESIGITLDLMKLRNATNGEIIKH